VWTSPNGYARAMPDQIELLGSVPLFSTVPKKDLRVLARTAHDMTYEPGTRLASQDDLGVTFFTVIEGGADVVLNGKPIRHLGPGDYFGEMSIIDRAPRSADVVATSKLRCLVFTQWEFRPFLKEHPDVAWALLEVLVARLREAQKKGPGHAADGVADIIGSDA
jgi:CRP-like cAMP-binding protein